MADARDEYQQHLLRTIQGLSDLELAVLLCLIAREHCLISTVPDSVDELADELRLVATKTFNLRSVIVNCHSHTTLDDFATAFLIPAPRASSPIAGSSRNTNGQNDNPSKDTRSISPFGPQQNDRQSGSYFFQPSRAASSSAGIRVGGVGGSGNIPMSLTGQSYPTETKQQQQIQPQIANIIIAKHLDRAPKAVQIQALELLRTRRIFTRTSVQPAPKQFLFIALVGAASGGQARVTKHLNDFFYISHWHDSDEDGFPHLDRDYNGEQDYDDDGESSDADIYDLHDDGASTNSGSSVVKKTPAIGIGGGSGSGFSPSLSSSSLRRKQKQKQPQQLTEDYDYTSNTNNQQQQPPPAPIPVLNESDISHLARQTQHVRVDIEVTRYQMNIIAFLRMHRAVAAAGGGISPFATKHFDQLMKSLAPLHGIDYVTPSLVALAVRKIYLHRIEIVSHPLGERSVQWGGEVAAIGTLLGGVGPEEVIEDVLGMVGVPS